MNERIDLNEFHGLLAIVQSIDVGVVVFDEDYRVLVWNTFMENRSGIQPGAANGASFFELFPEVDSKWFRKKVEGVAALGTPAFTVWEQRPYLLRFKNYQPITGREDFMYQNTTLFPLRSVTGNSGHICLVIYDVTDVANNRRQLLSANAELLKLSSTDRLTGLYNRGYWEESLQKEHARHRRYDSTATLIMLDIDHFKRINDTYGHQAGDKAIQRVADAIRTLTRDMDVSGRYGGEEFVILLPDTTKEGGRVFAERLRQHVAALKIEHAGEILRMTISLGVADLSITCDHHEEWIRWADEALYASKEDGRNRVTVYE
ncbi:MAG: diguanylate cyclase [Pseudomonas sp.]